ncbi:HPr kinase/phosphatase C-terminal domain-containing protein [Gluconobacter albidus]|uniref:HPr kinase/phosphorylase n=1 Tax=Gluconobacter albidus TaxID=318683 RepID=UPI00098AEA78|nr:HPr kinase/phosphatase C-terminal domain-containing protein [Gluconobacter albidus]MCP1273024.1 HPr kinase/phosphatase C-terminal domain-containing protein [Gluconobacter albidus]
MSVPPSLSEGSVHASCVAWNGAGVLISGPSGSGKSELALRLMDAGFDLVADDRVLLDGAVASAPARLAGLIEVRGVGILRTPFVTKVPVSLRVCLGQGQPRLPEACRDPWTGAVMLSLEPGFPGTVARIRAALKACCGSYEWVAGAGENVEEM